MSKKTEKNEISRRAFLGTSAAAAVGFTLLPGDIAGSSPAGPLSNILRTDERLNVNESLISKNGQYELLLQGDGNLVLLRRANRHPIWASGTNGKDVAAAVMQGDGNFVIYGYRNEAFWSSDTMGKFGAWLLLHDVGKLYIIQPVGVWCAGCGGFDIGPRIGFPDLI